MRRRIAIARPLMQAASVVACLSLLAACKAKDEGGDEDVQAVVAAKIDVVTPQAFTETMGAIGTVVARAGHVATLSAPAAGRVGKVYVTVGQVVQADQPLIELDQAPFRISTEAADAALASAERNAERQQRLANEGIAPRKDAEQAAADVARARADADAAHRAEQLSVLRSPIAGVVTHMSATLGASVDPAAPLVEVSDPTALDVVLSVTPPEAARVRPGMKVTLTAGQSATGEPLGVAVVTDISGAVDTLTRSVAVRAQAPTTRRPLRIGETVFGQIAVATIPNAIVVPVEAIVPVEDKFNVFVVDDKSIAHAREVDVAARSNGMAEITSGLKAGERIVTYGAYGMQDSAKVSPLKTAPDTSGAEAKKP